MIITKSPADEKIAALTGPDATAATPDVVTGRPLTWLRIEMLAVAGAVLALFAGTVQSWWLITD